MGLSLVTAATSEPLGLEETKVHLRVDGSAVLQAGTLIEIALAASTATFPGGSPEIRDLSVLRPIRLEEGGRRQVQVVLREGMGGAGQILISSRDRQCQEIEWELHATCQIERRKGMSVEREGQALDRVEAWMIRRALTNNGGRKARTARKLGLTREGLYKKIKRLGVE